MVFLIVAESEPKKVMLVKADNREHLEQRLHLLEGEEISGSFTTAQIHSLNDGSFGVITG